MPLAGTTRRDGASDLLVCREALTAFESPKLRATASPASARRAKEDILRARLDARRALKAERWASTGVGQPLDRRGSQLDVVRTIV